MTKLNPIIFIFVLQVLFFCWSCGETGQLVYPSKASFYPTKKDKFIIYSYEEFNHDAFNSSTDTTTYWIKETIETPFIDQEKDSSYQLRIDYSYDEGLNWEFQYYAVIKVDNYSLERSDLDVKRIKLSFPVKDNKSWDVNMLNSQETQYGFYQNTDGLYRIKDSLFSETVIVNLGDQEDIIFTIFEEEVYARGIGLILRKFRDIETQPGKYKDGIEYTKTIIRSNW